MENEEFLLVTFTLPLCRLSPSRRCRKTKQNKTKTEMSHNEKGGNNFNFDENKSFKSILSELTVDSPTFTFIEYFLRLNLNASTAKIIQSFEVSNPQLTLQFEKRSKVKWELLRSKDPLLIN